MQHGITSPVPQQAEQTITATAVPAPEPKAVAAWNPAEYAAAAARLCPWWQQATPEQQALVLADMGWACGIDGLPVEEYWHQPDSLENHLANIDADALRSQGLLDPQERAAPTPEQAAPSPEQTTPAESTPAPAAVVQEQTPEQAVAAGAQDAADQAAEQEARTRELAEKLAQAAATAYRRGEKAYAAGLLECGRLCDEYLHQRMALADKRAAGVQRLEGLLSAYSSTVVDVNRLIACHHARRLLAVEPGLTAKEPGKKTAPADSVPYGHYRDCYARLVERQDKDTPQEHWSLLPGLEQESRELYRKAVQDGLSKEAVHDAVRGLLKTHADRQEQRAKALATEKAAAEKAAQEQRSKAAEEVHALAAQAQQARQQAEQAQADQRATLTQAADQAKAALLAKQQELAEAHAKAEQERKAKEQAEQQAKAAEEARSKAQAKAVKAAEKAAEQDKAKATATAAPGTKSQGQPSATGTRAESSPPPLSVPDMTRKATPKNAADLLATALLANPDPSSTLEHLLDMLLDAAEGLTPTAVGAITAALAVYRGTPAVTAVAQSKTLPYGGLSPQEVATLLAAKQPAAATAVAVAVPAA